MIAKPLALLSWLHWNWIKNKTMRVLHYISKFSTPKFLFEDFRVIVFMLLICFSFGILSAETYSNPIIHADYSDPDVIRVNDDYYMTASSFAHTPGLPILHSKDLVNWKLIGHAIENLPDTVFNTPQHGKGVWAPAIRYHKGEFKIYYGDPDFGIYLVKTKNIQGSWEKPLLILPGKGLIDPCPFRDDDGNAYLVHAWAKSRAGFNSILTLNRMNEDGTKIIDEGVMIFDGHEKHPTIEGPKMYKRNGYYYIFAPAGGVRSGWQTILRSKNIYGPYEDKIVMEQGCTQINGPHQGGWIKTQSGQSWFIHFQDKRPYGRIVHLNPVKWENDWPVMGEDFDGNGIGEPVTSYQRPHIQTSSLFTLQTSDEFNNESIGLQWQWEGNHSKDWYSLTENPGFLRLYAQPAPLNNLYHLSSVIGQKFPYEKFDVLTKINLHSETTAEAGIVILGFDYAALKITQTESNTYCINFNECKKAKTGAVETNIAAIKVSNSEAYFKIEIRKSAVCQFYYSIDGKTYQMIGEKFTAQKGRWVGAKIGLFATGNGHADFDYFQINKHE